MKKLMLMAGLLLASLYACNQEEEALKTLKPTDGGEVMTTASGTLTPAELLAQDSLMIVYYTHMKALVGHGALDADENYSNDSANSSTFIVDMCHNRNNVRNNYSGFSGMSDQDINDLILDALTHLTSNEPGYQGADPDGLKKQCEKYHACHAFWNEQLARRAASGENVSVLSPAWSDWVDGLAGCCLAYKRACRDGCGHN